MCYYCFRLCGISQQELQKALLIKCEKTKLYTCVEQAKANKLKMNLFNSTTNWISNSR